MKREAIQIRDPFILKHEDMYYMYGTTDKNPWSGEGVGFDCYKTKDLENFDGPFSVFQNYDGFFGYQQFWAPEVHAYQNKFYMLASFKPREGFRGTLILEADHPLGPFEPLTNKPITPEHLECLDGTLFIDEGKIYLVFSHEWCQCHDGAICVVELSKDLKNRIGPITTLFNASEAPWSRAMKTDTPCYKNMSFPCYVTDGPYLFREEDTIKMIWSSFTDTGYALGLATAKHIFGPWSHNEKPLFEEDGGHGMVFDFNDKKMIALHHPNAKNERAKFITLSHK